MRQVNQALRSRGCSPAGIRTGDRVGARGQGERRRLLVDLQGSTRIAVKKHFGQFRPGFVMTLPSAKGAPIIGGIGFRREGDGLELGYWVARDHWGRGYATEAGRAALEVARALGHRRIDAGHYLDNPASGRVLRKLGFRDTGEVRPTFCRARGGELVLARRYALEFAEAEADSDTQVDRMRAA